MVEHEIGLLRKRIEQVEAERCAFLQEGVFDLVKNITKQNNRDDSEHNLDELIRLRLENNNLRRTILERNQHLDSISNRLSQLE